MAIRCQTCQYYKQAEYNYIFQCLYVLGAFDDEDIIHVEGNVDPVRDIEIIHEELRLKDQEMIDPILDKLEKTAVRGSDKKLKPEFVSKAGLCELMQGKIDVTICKQFVYAYNLLLLALGYHAEDKELGGGGEETRPILQ